jgi:hypothetical protein
MQACHGDSLRSSLTAEEATTEKAKHAAYSKFDSGMTKEAIDRTASREGLIVLVPSPSDIEPLSKPPGSCLRSVASLIDTICTVVLVPSAFELDNQIKWRITYLASVSSLAGILYTT